MASQFPVVPGGVVVQVPPTYPAAALAARTFAQAALLNPVTVTGNGTGPAAQLSALGPATGSFRFFAQLETGAISSGTTITAKLQESANGTTGWADVAGGAFADVTANFKKELLYFAPTLAYARLSYTATGGTPSVLVSARVGLLRF